PGGFRGGQGTGVGRWPIVNHGRPERPPWHNAAIVQPPRPRQRTPAMSSPQSMYSTCPRILLKNIHIKRWREFKTVDELAGREAARVVLVGVVRRIDGVRIQPGRPEMGSRERQAARGGPFRDGPPRAGRAGGFRTKKTKANLSLRSLLHQLFSR